MVFFWKFPLSCMFLIGKTGRGPLYYLSYPPLWVIFWLSEGGSFRCLIAQPHLHQIYHINLNWLFLLVDHFPVQIAHVFTPRWHRYLSQTTLSSSFSDPHPQTHNYPIIFPPSVPFVCVFNMRVFTHMCMYVCVWLMGTKCCVWFTFIVIPPELV